jgi:hypothetical protein
MVSSTEKETNIIALNLEGKYSPTSHNAAPNHLPPVQELFKTADHPNLYPPTYVPTPMVIDEDRALLNNLTSRFMHFPEPKKEIEIPEKPQKPEEPGVRTIIILFSIVH